MITHYVSQKRYITYISSVDKRCHFVFNHPLVLLVSVFFWVISLYVLLWDSFLMQVSCLFLILHISAQIKPDSTILIYSWNIVEYLEYHTGLALWCLTPLSTIFQLYRGGQFYWWRKHEYLGENHRPTASHWQTLIT